MSCEGTPLGLVRVDDAVKPGLRNRFAQLRGLGIRTVMITGDNPLTAAAIAAASGVDDYVARATPATKLELIRREQAKGNITAMCDDGVNDAPALRQADVGIAMGLGSAAAREAGAMIDLDSDPLKFNCIGLDLFGQLSDLGERLRASDRCDQEAANMGWLC